MAENSAIEWTDATWTPVVGCDAVSPGCANCYAATMAARLEAMGQAKYAGLATRVGSKGKWTGKVNLSESDLLAPLKKRKPTKWFLTSMGDVFHDGVPDEFIDRLFAVMALCPQHTFQVLTKRPERAAAYLSSLGRGGIIHDASAKLGALQPYRWPLSNVLIGCTAEDQRRADERRPNMGRIAAAGWQTFVSYEPALGMVDWTGWKFLSWLISGGESGPGARPSHPDWHRAARDFCAARGIPYMLKQWGAWLHSSQDNGSIHYGRHQMHAWSALHEEASFRVGKKAAGRLLDGVLHDGYPSP